MAIEKAWVQFTPGTPPTVNAGKNITSVARNADGDYSINLKDELVNSYVVTHIALGGMSIAGANRLHPKCETVNVRQLRVRTYNFAGALANASELSVFAETDNDDSAGA